MTKVLGTKLSTLWTRINTVLVPRQATVTTTGSYHVVTLQNAVTPTPDALVSFSIPASSGGSGDANQNAFSYVNIGGTTTTIAADSTTDTLTISAGNNISLTGDTSNDILTISATDTTYSNATTATSGLMSATDKSKLDAMSGGSVWYGTCATTASTAEKAVTCDGFDYKIGSIIAVLFTTANTAATPTLNVNSKGAKSILIGTASANSINNVLKWSANTILLFIYSGYEFRYLTAVASGTAIPPRGANTWYGSCSTTASTAAKTSTIDNFVLTKGSFVILQTITANTVSDAAITLNVNSTGAATVYYGNATTSSTNKLPWNAYDVLTFMYDGTYWRYVSGSTAISPSITETDPIFSGSAAAGITAGDITNWNGKTSNIGTVTAVKINNTTKTASSGIVDIGTVLTTYTYTLPTASSTTLGGIKIGSGLSVSATTGVVSATDTKNTAGATATNAMIYLIGATASTTNPQTYTVDSPNGLYYSNGLYSYAYYLDIMTNGYTYQTALDQGSQSISIYSRDISNNTYNRIAATPSAINILANNLSSSINIEGSNVSITGVVTPTVATNAANKAYVDNKIKIQNVYSNFYSADSNWATVSAAASSLSIGDDGRCYYIAVTNLTTTAAVQLNIPTNVVAPVFALCGSVDSTSGDSTIHTVVAAANGKVNIPAVTSGSFNMIAQYATPS